MSRRSRRRKGASDSSSKGSKWLIILIAMIMIMVVTIGVVHTMIRRYLHSEDFRHFVSAKVSEAIHVEGQFKPLQWDGLEVRTEGFAAEGDEVLRDIRIDGVRTEIGLGGFWDGVWEVKGVRIREVNVELDGRKGVAPVGAAPKAATTQKTPGKPKSGWLPREVELKNMLVERLAVKAMLRSGPATLAGTRLEAVPGTGAQTYEVQLSGGRLSLPQKIAPEIRLVNASIKYQDGAIFLTKAHARAWNQASVEMSGEWDPALDIRSAQGAVDGVACKEVVSDDWSKRLRGTLSSDFETIWVGGEPHSSGHLVLRDGVVTALPILEVLEAYLDTSRFRMLALSEAHTDWAWRKGQWSVKNLVIASEGLMRIEGSMRVTGEKLDGNFRLGLAPGTLASIPGAEKHVFLAGERGLRWAPVRITGTLSEPEHDLTERLIEAAGRRLLEALPEATLEAMLLGKDVIDHSTQEAVREGFKLLEGGAGVLEGGPDVIQGGSDLIQGILGGGR